MSPKTDPRKGEDLVHSIQVSLEDIYKGKTTELCLTKHIICGECNGDSARKCYTCKGCGERVVMRRRRLTLQKVPQHCDDCDGTGKVIDPEYRCEKCLGKKVMSEKKVLEVHIDKGVETGKKITFSGESDQAPDTIPGDVVIVLDEKPHERFRREGNDLWHETEIDLLTALGGGSFPIMHLDDRALIVNLVPGGVTKHGALKVIQGQGMPAYGQPERGTGDLYIRIFVAFPVYIVPSVIPFLEGALPPHRDLPEFDEKIELEEVELSVDLATIGQRKAADKGRGDRSHLHKGGDPDQSEETTHA
ncbi:Type I HSP40 co-chaperone [Tulasnella sp. 403]|nr:Type I HSP40 co-chaperone [Tulasnella sp. 403]